MYIPGLYHTLVPSHVFLACKSNGSLGKSGPAFISIKVKISLTLSQFVRTFRALAKFPRFLNLQKCFPFNRPREAPMRVRENFAGLRVPQKAIFYANFLRRYDSPCSNWFIWWTCYCSALISQQPSYPTFFGILLIPFTNGARNNYRRIRSAVLRADFRLVTRSMIP